MCTAGFVHCVLFFFTLILCSSAKGGLLQVFEQEGFKDLRAAVEGSQDVQQPPASLATITAKCKSAWIHSGLQAWGTERSVCVCVLGWAVVCTSVMYSSRLTVWSWC